MSSFNFKTLNYSSLIWCVQNSYVSRPQPHTPVDEESTGGTVLKDSIATGPKPLTFGSGRGELLLSLSQGFDHIDGLDALGTYVFINTLQGQLDRLFTKASCRSAYVHSHDEPILLVTNNVHIQASVWVQADIDPGLAASAQQMLNFSLWQAVSATVVFLRSGEILDGSLPSIEDVDVFVEWALDALVYTYDMHLAELHPSNSRQPL
jgi:hypothetical protein